MTPEEIEKIRSIKRTFRIADYLTNYKGQLFVKSLCDFFSEVALEHAELLGFGIETLNRQNITWMAHRFRIEIEKMPSHGQEVEMQTMPTGIDRLLALRCFRLFENGEPIVKAYSEWLLVDIARRKPIRPIPLVVERCSINEVPADVQRAGIVAALVPQQMELARHFVATFDNIDFNGHVTQASYLMWASNSLPFDFHRQHALCEAEVVYENEISIEQDIDAYIAIEEHNSETWVWHRLISPADNRSHCFALTKWKKI